MLLRRVVLALGQRQLQSANQCGARISRLNHIINQPARGSHVGIVELLFVLLSQFLPLGFLVFGFLHLFAEQDVDGPFRAHDGNFGIGPGVKQIAAQALAAHHAVGTAVAFAQNHHQLGHGGFTVGINHARPVADDAAVFLIFAGQKAGHILQGNDGNVVRIANADEMCRFDRRFDVHAARQHHRLVGHDADHVAIEPGKADHHVFGPQLVHFKETAVIDQTMNHAAHIVRLVRIGRHHVLQLRRTPIGVIDRADVGWVLFVVARQIAQQLTHAQQAFSVVAGEEVADAAFLAMHQPAAQLFKGHFFLHDGLHHLRSRDEHVALLGHKDKVGEGR